MKWTKWVVNLSIGSGIILVSIMGGIYGGQAEFWEFLKSYLGLWFLISFFISMWGMWKIFTYAIEKDGFINLLWLGLPAYSAFGIDLFFRSPLFRSLVLTCLCLVGLVFLWGAAQKRQKA